MKGKRARALHRAEAAKEGYEKKPEFMEFLRKDEHKYRTNAKLLLRRARRLEEIKLKWAEKADAGVVKAKKLRRRN